LASVCFVSRVLVPPRRFSRRQVISTPKHAKYLAANLIAELSARRQSGHGIPRRRPTGPQYRFGIRRHTVPEHSSLTHRMGMGESRGPWKCFLYISVWFGMWLCTMLWYITLSRMGMREIRSLSDPYWTRERENQKNLINQII
jgi:hypothetical protein